MIVLDRRAHVGDGGSPQLLGLGRVAAPHRGQNSAMIA
jgi:hypothetical protein